jgi:hypothetical protein
MKKRRLPLQETSYEKYQSFWTSLLLILSTILALPLYSISMANMAGFVYVVREDVTNIPGSSEVYAKLW